MSRKEYVVMLTLVNGSNILTKVPLMDLDTTLSYELQVFRYFNTRYTGRLMGTEIFREITKYRDEFAEDKEYNLGINLDHIVEIKFIMVKK